jgi:hypothetical protein
MSSTTISSPIYLGFLTVVQEGGGQAGGLLVTNAWGRPVEFRLTNPVQPTKVQQLLYGETLLPFLYGDLIGKTLVDRVQTALRAVLTDMPPALELRQSIEIPVLLLATEQLSIEAVEVRPGCFTHPQFPDDVAPLGTLLDHLKGKLDLVEPFGRIREAMAEARRQGLPRAA